MAEEQNRTLQDKFMLRFPEGMREQVKRVAESSGRSMNAEIIHRLDATFAASDDYAKMEEEVVRLNSVIDARDREIESIRQLLEDYKLLSEQKSAFVNAVCFRILQFKDQVPEEAVSFASGLINATDPVGGEWAMEDSRVAESRYHASLRKVTSKETLAAEQRIKQKK